MDKGSARCPVAVSLITRQSTKKEKDVRQADDEGTRLTWTTMTSDLRRKWEETMGSRASLGGSAGAKAQSVHRVNVTTSSLTSDDEDDF